MADLQQIKVVFFDLGATLVEPEFSPQGEFTGFTVLPGVVDALREFSKTGLQLGVISDTGDLDPKVVRAELAKAGLAKSFTEKLVLLSGEVHLDKSSPQIFRLALQLAKVDSPHAAIFVGEDSDERRTARRTGMQSAPSLEALRQRLNSPPAAAPDISNLAACTDDARSAALDSSRGPAEPTDYASLVGRLEQASEHLPPIYRDRYATPYIATLRRIGAAGFAQILARDPQRDRAAGLMLDIAQAILQNGEGFEPIATDGFEEVVSDLYDGFLSAEDRAGITPPDTITLAPLVKWGNPDFGPYTWPIDATRSFAVQAAVVNLPPANAHKGLLAWAALGHETAGHDVLHANNGLEAEMARMVRQSLKTAGVGAGLPDYWAERVDETASDVMGILNMGPAAAISLIAYFRGLRAAFSGRATLSNVGRLDDPHPADILRGFLGASVVRLLGFEDAYAWAEVIEKETMRDVTSIRIGNVPVTVAQAKKSADVVAATIALGRLTTLGNHALIDIQNWQNTDEAVATTLQTSLLTNEPVDPTHASGIYAAHIVAAAVTAALAGKGAIGDIFQRMVAVLKDMHDANAAWGPLYVIHPGDIHRDMILDSLNRRDESVQPGLAQLIDLRSPAAITARA